MEKLLKSSKAKIILAASVFAITFTGIGIYLYANQDRTQDYIAFQDSLEEAFCNSEFSRSCSYTMYGAIDTTIERIVEAIEDSGFLSINCNNIQGAYRQDCKNQQSKIKSFLSTTNNGKDFEQSDKYYLDELFKTISK